MATSSISRPPPVDVFRLAADCRPHNADGDLAVSFGQPAGPPASAQQMRRLLELVQAAGHTDFRDARGPLQLTQRQAAGRFTRNEAEDLIARLENEVDDADSANTLPIGATQWSLRSVPDAVLAAELQQRGWIVVEP